MSFGASPSDIIIVVTFARRLYRSCKNAGGEYLEISREVRGLHTVLRHLKYEVEDADSILNREKARYGRELAPVIGDCDYTLRQLDELLMKYDRLSQTDGSGAGRLWDKIRFGSNELDELGSIRMKLINHKTSITVFLDTIQLHESGRMATALDNQTGQLDVILDKVDNIAARMGQRAGSIMTTYDDDDKEVWKQFRRELVAEGFSSDVLQQHRDVLRAYIRDIDQRGMLEEVRADPAPRPQSGVDPQQWLENIPHVQSPMSDGGTIPPSFSSLNVNSEDNSAKMLAVGEENLKFPQSMKDEIAQQSKAVQGDAAKQLVTPTNEKVVVPKEGIVDIKTFPAPTNAYTTGKPLSNDDLEPSSPISQAAYTTSELPKPGGLAIPVARRRPDSREEHSPGGSPASYRSYTSYADDIPRSMAYRPKPNQPTSESSQYGTSPSSAFANGASRYVPTPSVVSSKSSKLAPDSQGNPIPDDARWTKIRRSLVSPEVLAQDGRRYEARPDFVAVLGMLSREEVEDYAARTLDLRAARAYKTAPPVQPPRPQRRPERRHSSSSSEESEDDYQRRRRSSNRERRSYPNPASSTQAPPYGHSPSHGATWPVPAPPQQAWGAQQAYQPPLPSAGWTQQVPQQMPQYYPSSAPDDPRRRGGGGSGGGGGDRKKSSWRNNLTAAGVGGAAGSLLSVLVEAAQDL